MVIPDADTQERGTLPSDTCMHSHHANIFKRFMLVANTPAANGFTLPSEIFLSFAGTFHYYIAKRLPFRAR